MNLELNEEQALLRDSVARFVGEHYSLEQRRSIVRSERGHSAEHWQMMAELGWLAVPFAERDGGMGGSAIDTMVMMEQFGKGLVLEPFFTSIVLGGAALRHGASDNIKQRLLSGVIDGTRQLAFAHAERSARFDLQHVATRACPDGAGFVLHGLKSFVLNLEAADTIVVSARTGGAITDRDGITLFLLERDCPGVSIQSYPTVDGGRAGDLSLHGVHLARSSVLGEVDAGCGIVNAVASEAMLALAAEAVGAMQVLYQDTVQYTQQRIQFGHPLANFQVLQHRMVDMFTEYELARSLLYRATLESAQSLPSAQRSIHALKYLVGRAGMFVAESAVQLHGGMGMTEELRVGHYLKRMLVIDLLFGNAEHHLQKFSE